MARTHMIAAAAASLLGVTLLAGCVSPQSGGSGAESSAGNLVGQCPIDADESITSTARIAYQPIPNGDLIVKDLGWLEACMPNASIEWSKYASGADVVQAFGAGSADIGLAGSGPAVRMLADPLNLDVRVVWIHDVIGDAESLVTQDELGSVSDLTGKTIAVPFGSTAHFSLLAALEEAGLTTDDVTLINLAPDAMLAAWDRKEIDGAWVWDPTLSELKKNGTLLLSAAETAEAGRPTFDLGVASTAFVEANPEFMDMWTQLQSRAADMLNNDTELAAESLAIELGISVEEAIAQLPGYIYLPASQQLDSAYFGGDLAQVLIATAAFLHGQGLIDGTGEDDRYLSGVWANAIENAAR